MKIMLFESQLLSISSCIFTPNFSLVVYVSYSNVVCVSTLGYLCSSYVKLDFRDVNSIDSIRRGSPFCTPPSPCSTSTPRFSGIPNFDSSAEGDVGVEDLDRGRDERDIEVEVGMRNDDDNNDHHDMRKRWRWRCQYCW
jgi:hypothetical protein